LSELALTVIVAFGRIDQFVAGGNWIVVVFWYVLGFDLYQDEFGDIVADATG
jgi:hypothetical protein